MSRNLRHKSEATPPKKSARRSSRTTDNSSDDDYAGVELISDSEEDEPDVEVAEEQAIIQSEEEDDDDAMQSTPRPSLDDDQSSWDGFGDMNSQEVLGDIPFFEDHISRMDAPDHDTESAAWNATNGDDSDEESSPDIPRRVRFDLSDSSSTISDNEDNIFPDIFLDQNSLDPTFRKIIENGDDNEDEPGISSDEGSYWDFRGSDAENVVEGSGDDGQNDSDCSTGSSGYETDEGETTEEDLPAAAKYIPARSVLRRQSTDTSGSEQDITLIRRGPYRPINRNGPKLGSWVHDVSKPFAVMDSHGKRLIMFKAKINRRYSFSGTGNRQMPQLGSAQESDSEIPGIDQMSPMISNSANLMMSAMYTPMDNILGSQALGPPEAFYPWTNISADGTIVQDSPSSYDEDDLDDEDLWNVEDFLNFGENSSDEEDALEEQDDDSGSPTTVDPPSSTPARPSTAISEDQAHPLLSHFNSGVVGAFRRNQTRHQLLSRNTASRESLAFSGPYRQGTLRGIKGGRITAANAPITPLRKQKAAKASIMASSPGSPLAAATAAQKKRKFTGEQHTHKRSRSMI